MAARKWIFYAQESQVHGFERSRSHSITDVGHAEEAGYPFWAEISKADLEPTRRIIIGTRTAEGQIPKWALAKNRYRRLRWRRNVDKQSNRARGNGSQV